MKTPKELFDYKDYEVSYDLNDLKGQTYNNHFCELPELDCIGWFDTSNTNVDKDVEIRILKDFNFDGRRYWLLRTIWYKGAPIMITQNAGREGDDHSRRFIVNYQGYIDLLNYLRSQIDVMGDDDLEDEIVDMNEDFGDQLISFYGNELNGYFERY